MKPCGCKACAFVGLTLWQNLFHYHLNDLSAALDDVDTVGEHAAGVDELSVDAVDEAALVGDDASVFNFHDELVGSGNVVDAGDRAPVVVVAQSGQCQCEVVGRNPCACEWNTILTFDVLAAAGEGGVVGETDGEDHGSSRWQELRYVVPAIADVGVCTG
jgi:hypothetical protein